jgi:hypothetical protein
VRDVVLEVLLAPQQAGQGLAHHQLLVVGKLGGDDAGVELVGLLMTLAENGVEVLAQCIFRGLGRRILVSDMGQTHPHRRALAGRNGDGVVRRRLGAGLLRVDGVRAS